MTEYTILLPPSEGKASGGDEGLTWAEIADDAEHNAFRVLNEARHQVIDALEQAMETLDRSALEKLFGVKGDNLDAALSANWNVRSGPLLPAIERYTGVMFDYLDYEGMDSDMQNAFERRTILFSGLWGLLRPIDLIPDYKLKIDASLPALDGRMSSFWKPHVSDLLNPLLAGHVIWDMLPNAHRRAWDGNADAAVRYEVKFVQRREKNGEVSYRTVSHWSKALKGALIRFICANHVTEPEALADFSHPQGYAYSAEKSEVGDAGGEIVFVKGED